ncbi:MAG TPA: hypothetical protein VM536_16895, partial [Chloroflexia bacterium]|nr:hypothetical protein [Chloroflexia bacterium]
MIRVPARPAVRLLFVSTLLLAGCGGTPASPTALPPSPTLAAVPTASPITALPAATVAPPSVTTVPATPSPLPTMDPVSLIERRDARFLISPQTLLTELQEPT